MFSPKLYRVNKLPLKHILAADLDIDVEREENNIYSVLQQDSPLLRQLRMLTNDHAGIYNPNIIFVDAKGANSNKEGLERIVTNGFYFNNRHFVLSERSASMVRQSILSFVDNRLIDKTNEIVTMGLTIEKTVLSKWTAYRGLMLSSCHCLEGWKPKIIIVPDCYATIKDQSIKYVVDEEKEYTDSEGQLKIWKQKGIKEGVRGVEINLFDGCGICHPDITDEMEARLNELGDMKGVRPTSALIRAPFIKGMVHELDYVNFFEERGVEFVKDIWGAWHDVRQGSTPMMILPESCYKGYKYFKRHNDKRDWESYWDAFDKYNHCIGVVKWNYSLEEEEVYRRGNYQILQDLNLDYSDFRNLANYTAEWVEDIVTGEWKYVACFLGLLADRFNASANYVKAALKNPMMVNEKGVRKYLINQLNKYIDEMKCGKLYLKATNRFSAPDLIMFMEYVGELELKGCLTEDEFWSQNLNGDYIGKYLIERNPHIAHSEHVVLNGVTNDLIENHIKHLSNVCMLNSKSLVAQRLNGSDFDGDGILVVDNTDMMTGVDVNASIVIDIEDKATALEQEDTQENKFKIILLGMHSLIGETSNCATTYHNKMPQTIEQKKKYESFIDLLCVINGKAIDAAKTGVIFKIPRSIAKYSKPIPYFMKYAGSYYARQRKFLKSQSNMNRLCWNIEKWARNMKWKKHDENFDYKIMIDGSVEHDESVFISLEKIYKEYNAESQQLKKDELSIQRDLGGSDRFELNWDIFYDKYRAMCFAACPDKKMLVNALVTLCYETYPRGTTGFLWNMAGDFLAENIKQVDVELPVKDEANGDFEYLGKRYRMVKHEKPMLDKFVLGVSLEENNLDDLENAKW